MGVTAVLCDGWVARSGVPRDLRPHEHHRGSVTLVTLYHGPVLPHLLL